MDPRVELSGSSVRWLRTAAGLLCLAASLGSGCIQDDGQRFNPLRDFTQVSEDQERELGMEFDREVQKHLTVIQDPVVTGFINDLGQELVRGIEPQPFIYRFRIIRDDSLNAFAVPGGYVYFHSGTVLAAASIDELAGVMGHEIGHVKGHHYARMRRQSQIPDLLVGLAGMAAAVATGEPGIMVASQAANVAVKLKFSREFETEADRVGAIFMTRAGYDANGIGRFFERLLAQQRRHPNNVPPYLFSHPAVEDRLDAVAINARDLTPTRAPNPDIELEFREAQHRLQRLVDLGRTRLPLELPPANRDRTDPQLAYAAALIERGEVDAALRVLERAEADEPNDPRVPYRMGELLADAKRPLEAVAAFRRTVALDPSRALVFFKLGLAYKNSGDRHRAVYALEQSVLRAGEGSELRKRADWEIVKLTFSVVRESGFADGNTDAAADTPAGFAIEAARPGAREVVWWARLGPQFIPFAEQLSVRWLGPAGNSFQEQSAEALRKPFIASRLDPRAGGLPTPGDWTVEVRLEDDLIHREVLPAVSTQAVGSDGR